MTSSTINSTSMNKALAHPHVGTGEVARAGSPSKASLLDHDALPVPPSLVLLPGIEPSPSLFEAIAGLVDGWPVRRVAVRSAFGAEDQTDQANAGRFASVLDVSADDPAELTAAIDTVRASATEINTVRASATEINTVRASATEINTVRASATEINTASFRTDVLVMAMVSARVSGVAFTERAFEDDLVNVVDGLAEDLVSGQVGGGRIDLPKLRVAERPRRSRTAWEQRLQELLRTVRRVHGDADWDVEWADDGTSCWLVQVRPITAAPRRDEAFTIANHKEILPELPSTLMTSIIEGAADDLMGFYRRIDPSLPIDRPYVEVFEGRPYVNLSVMTDVLRALGLPTSMLADSMGGDVEIVEPLRPLRIVSRIPAFLRLARTQLTAVGAAQRTGRDLIAEATVLGGRPDATFGELLDQARSTYVHIVETMSGLASNMAIPVGLLRRLGTLGEHGASQRTAATMMIDDLAPVAALLEAGIERDHPDVRRALDRWLSKHGHRGMYESDLAQPRFADDLSPIMAMAAMGSARAREDDPRRSARAWATLPLWKVAAPAMAAREQFRSDAMRAFGHLRDALIATAERAVDNGTLPRTDAIWLLTTDELRTIDDGASFTEADLAERESEREQLAALRLPDLIHRFDDLRSSETRVPGEPRTSFRGIPLTKGQVTGRALPAWTPPDSLPPDAKSSVVLVARSIDAGWVPTLSQVAAVIVAIGGDLSHGSIIVRELGLPAATNFGEDLMDIAPGTMLDVDANRGLVTVVDNTA